MKVFKYLFSVLLRSIKLGLLLLMVSTLLFLSFFYSQFSGPQKESQKERFVVKLNVSEEEMVADLKEKGFLKSKEIFGLILTFKGWHKKIEPGAYKISKSMNAHGLAKTLISGPYQKWVIIPPGKRKEQVALILLKTLNWQFGMGRSFTNVAEEGYLYPDTYLIDVDADPQQVWQKLFANFNEKFDKELQNNLLAQNIRNDTAIKIASLIERESGSDFDKPIIAGIIWNRLLKGMKLEIDATVQYAIASETLDEVGLQDLGDFNFWPQLGAGVVRTTNSPYNTYLNKGLPPGPICSPSLESIRAVANPSETDALYYLHSSDKQIHTAKTFEEHQENIENFLKN